MQRQRHARQRLDSAQVRCAVCGQPRSRSRPAGRSGVFGSMCDPPQHVVALDAMRRGGRRLPGVGMHVQVSVRWVVWGPLC